MMRRKLFVIALLATIPGFFVAPAAKADDIVTNQWYNGAFNGVGNPIFGGTVYFYQGVNGPVLPSGFADSVVAPSGTSWTITLPGSGTLTVTDLEMSGDQFQMYDNGNLMSPAASPFTAPGQNPGQVSPGNGLTSYPSGSDYVYGDINAALGDSNFSSATFALSPGVNVITGNLFATIGEGDMAFIAESTPEPSTLFLLGTGLLGLAGLMRNKLRRN